MTDLDLRELDRQVALALGWSQEWDQHRLHQYWRPPGGGELRDESPAFTTDIAAAMECVNWLRERGWYLNLWSRETDEGLGWVAAFKKFEERGFQEVLKRAEEPALAICRAFLAAISAHPELAAGPGRK